MTVTRDRHQRVIEYIIRTLDWHDVVALMHGHGPVDCPDCGALLGENCLPWCPRYAEDPGE